MQRLGRYELIRVLGEGGMGVVWEATLVGPSGFRKPVALKLLKGSGEGLAREARLGGLLRHPNLVEVYALEEIDGTWVCAMELVGGGSLAGRPALPPAAVVEVGLQVCAGLAHAHAAVGLVHLDLKPANLLLAGGTVKVADFGIARARGFAEGRGRGTPAYMSPEQAGGRSTDARSDLWSLGVTLVELATGLLPSRVASDVTWSTVDDDRPVHVDVGALRAHEAPWLSPVLSRVLVADPEARVASAVELAALLRDLDVPGPGLAEALGVGTPAPAGRRTGTSGSTGRTRPEPERTNLRAEVDAFVGRVGELDALDRALDGAPITLKGMGGSGKTRLATRYGDRWQRATRGEVWFVDLATSRSRGDVLRAVAGVLGVDPGASGEDAVARQLGRALAERAPLLLILDNFEQIVGGSDLPAGWATAGPGVRVLVTSREPLRVSGEVVLELDPLPTDEAVDLLVRRAADRGRDVRDDPALPALAGRLDGLPLAIELAAGRLTVLSPSQLLERLERRLALLGGGAREGRQRSLRASLDVSWEALTEPERAALAQLSVFRGGFSLEAVERVLLLPPGAPWVLDLVAALVDRSLLVARSGAEPRYGLLESVRDYAAEHLDGDAVLRDRHAAWCVGFAVEATVGGGGDTLADWQRLSDEVPNLEAACAWALAAGRAGDAITVLRALAEVLDLRGPHDVLLDLVARIDALDPEPRQRARLRLVQGRALRRVGRLAESIAVFEEARALARGAGDGPLLAEASSHLGNLRRDVGEPKVALELLLEAEALYAAAGDAKRVAVTWGNQAAVHYNLGDLERARQLYERALLERRAHGDRRGVAHLLASVAVVEQVAGRLGAARRNYESALQVSREARDRRGEALALANLGVVAVDLGDHDAAERRWKQALDLRRQAGERAGVGILYGYLSQLAVERGRLEEARDHAERSLAIQRETGNRRLEAQMLGQLGSLALVEGRLDDATALLREARELQVAVADRIGLALSLLQWGKLERARGDVRGALAAFEAASEAAGTRHAGTHAMTLAWAAWATGELGDPTRARADVDRAVTLMRSADLSRGYAEVLAVRALVWRDRARLEEARAAGPLPGSPADRLIAEVDRLLGSVT